MLHDACLAHRGRLSRRHFRETERVRCFRADLQSAPERLRASFSSVLRPRRGVLPLHWDREGWVKCLPGPGPSKHGLELSQDVKVLARAAARRRKASAPRRLARFRARARASGNVCRCCAELVGCAFRRFASLFLPEADLFWRCGWHSSGAERRRENARHCERQRSNPGRLARRVGLLRCSQ